MKRPKVIMINSVSLDGSFINFKSDRKFSLELTKEYRPMMILEGSQSLVTGLTEMWNGTIPPEEEVDFIRPNKKPDEPYFVVPDSRGISKGLLHLSRRLCKYMGLSNDVMLLITEKTDREFIEYLEERHFEYHICGVEKVDFVEAFNILSERYGVDKIQVDAGPTLNGILLEQKLIDEIVLIIYPVLVGGTSDKLLSQLTDSTEAIKLELIEGREAGNDTVLLHYKIVW